MAKFPLSQASASLANERCSTVNPGQASFESIVAANRADALERVAEGFLARSDGAITGGDRCLMAVHTDVETLREAGVGVKSDLDSGSCVSAQASRRLACNCSLLEMMEDSYGQVLNVGRKSRSIPPAIRRTLNQRDGGCRFPGCTQQHHVDAHHIEHWADGGETKLDNLLLLCRFHHGLVHEGGYGLQTSVDGEYHFTRPTGEVIPKGPETRLRGDVFVLISQNNEAELNITPETPIPDWHGEGMDDDLVVSALLQYRDG